jgi:glycosyltransferase involved in cell wall biosynthesis
MKKLSKFKSVNRLIFVSPSNWLFDFLSEVYGEDRVIMISNSVDTTIFHYDVAIESTSASTNPVLLLVASDFQDRRKVDTKIVQTLIEEGVELHIAGANSPFTAANVVNHGRLAPMQLAKLMNVCNAHLFLSRIDNQPLVVLESLCSGMMQVSFKDKSVAGMGIENDCMFIENVTPEQLVSALSSNDFKEKISTEARQERAVKYQTLFSSDKMYVNYQRLYNSLISS